MPDTKNTACLLSSKSDIQLEIKLDQRGQKQHVVVSSPTF